MLKVAAAAMSAATMEDGISPVCPCRENRSSGRSHEGV